MKALWLEDHTLSVRDVDVPTPASGEALVRVVCAGVCSTDLELVRGYYPYTGTLGHEFVGVVEAGDDALAGQRVVGEINAVCGVCDTCVAGRPTHCERRTVLGIVDRHGAFAEYLSLPVANLHRVPDNVSTDAATFVEPLAAAMEIQEQIDVMADDRVLVVGDGKLGQLIAQTLRLTGCDLTVVGKHLDKLERFSTFAVTQLASDFNGAGFDIAVECTGDAGGFETARAALRAKGTLVMKSTYAGRLEVDASALVVDEITLVGSRCGPFAPAIALLEQGKIAVESMIAARYPLEDGLCAFEHAARPGVLKVLLDMAG
ncbi:MAG: alcohol dehydrogenase catalytic domain-containing protein [Gemmatimonadota bacterium]|nr:MAG: alcohol dehydrogenase catalytic domain-containing protein [Gemmatimonadota bacterium]